MNRSFALILVGGLACLTAASACSSQVVDPFGHHGDPINGNGTESSYDSCGGGDGPANAVAIPLGSLETHWDDPGTGSSGSGGGTGPDPSTIVIQVSNSFA